MINQQEQININKKLDDIQNYWSHCVPTGDWRQAELNTPIMSKFIQRYFNTKASKSTKLEYYNDVIDSLTDNNKLTGMATDALRMMDGELVNAIKVLANDTINIFSKDSMAFVNAELRKEFIQAQYQLNGTPVNQGDVVSEMNMSGCEGDVLVKILASLEVLPLLDASIKNMSDNIVTALPFIAATLSNSNNPNLMRALRQMCSLMETFGVLKAMISNMHEAAKTAVVSSSSVPARTGGVTVEVGSQVQEPTIAQTVGKVHQISKMFEPYGANVPNRVLDVLGGATMKDIEDIDTIINASSVPIHNSEKYLYALSTAYGFEQVPTVITSSPKNMTVALLYVAKIHADAAHNMNSTTGMIASSLSEILGQQVTAKPDFKCGMAEAISYDLDVANGNATTALSKMLGMYELGNFAKIFLTSNNIRPVLTRDSVREYVRQSSPYSSQITLTDISGFLDSKDYKTNGIPQFRQELIKAILTAINN